MADSVKRSIQLIPMKNNRPELIGLAPTHQAVKEMQALVFHRKH